MENFVHRKNLERFRQMLLTATDDEQRERIKRLLAEEEAKDRPAGPATPTRRGTAPPANPAVQYGVDPGTDSPTPGLAPGARH